jgi:hypothetical protein
MPFSKQCDLHLIRHLPATETRRSSQNSSYLDGDKSSHMKEADIIPWAFVGVAILITWLAIRPIVEFIRFLPRIFSSGDDKIRLILLLRASCFPVQLWLVIKHSSKISVIGSPQ